MKGNVFHGSPIQGLKELVLDINKHGFVYASRDLAIASFFVGKYGGDYTCTIHTPKNGSIHIVERYSDALKERYDREGSIYELSPESFFKSNEWRNEVKSRKSSKVIFERKIPNALENLFYLEEEGKLKIYKFPNRPRFVPIDDSDLLQKSVHFISIAGKDNVMRQLKKFHPHLYKKALMIFNSN